MEHKPEPISAAEDAARAALHERRYRCGLCGRGHDTVDCEACGTALGQWRNPEARPDAHTANQIVAQMRVARGHAVAPAPTAVEGSGHSLEWHLKGACRDRDAALDQIAALEAENTRLNDELKRRTDERDALRQRVAERDASAYAATRRGRKKCGGYSFLPCSRSLF